MLRLHNPRVAAAHSAVPRGWIWVGLVVMSWAVVIAGIVAISQMWQFITG